MRAALGVLSWKMRCNSEHDVVNPPKVGSLQDWRDFADPRILTKPAAHPKLEPVEIAGTLFLALFIAFFIGLLIWGVTLPDRCANQGLDKVWLPERYVPQLDGSVYHYTAGDWCVDPHDHTKVIN